jgi:hypothetical protein
MALRCNETSQSCPQLKWIYLWVVGDLTFITVFYLQETVRDHEHIPEI